MNHDFPECYKGIDDRANVIAECQPGKHRRENSVSRRQPNYAQNFSNFSNTEVRRKFIAKVYGIVGMQLVLTVTIVIMCYISEDVREHLKQNSYIYYMTALIPACILLCVLSCCCSRTFPINIVLLILITVLFSVAIAALCSTHKLVPLLVTLGVTCGIVFFVSIVSALMPIDVTKCYWILSILMLALVVFSIALMFVESPVMHKIYAGLGCALFILYLMIDTQMIVGGGREIELSSEDYIMGAMMIYVDVIYIFINLLQLIK